MICLQTVKQYCKEYWKIENYQEAVNDTTQPWDYHHRFEIDWNKTAKELIDMGRYYDVHYSELIFLPKADHMRLHRAGTHHTEEWKANMSAIMKNRILTEEWKNKIGSSNKGKKRTKEIKQKLCDAHTKYVITKEELYRLYVEKGLMQKEIAEIYNCHPGTILYKLKKFNIKK